MPSRQSESNAIASSPFFDQPFVDDVEHLEKRHVGRDVVGGVVHEASRARSGPACRQIFRFSLTLILVGESGLWEFGDSSLQP